MAYLIGIHITISVILKIRIELYGIRGIRLLRRGGA